MISTSCVSGFEDYLSLLPELKLDVKNQVGIYHTSYIIAKAKTYT